MQYKTIVLELLQQHQEMYDRLRKDRTLLSTLERLASQLKVSHQAWQERLAQAKTGGNQSQIPSQALEMAVQELEDRLAAALPPDETEPLSLDEAMAFIKSHTPPA